MKRSNLLPWLLVAAFSLTITAAHAQEIEAKRPRFATGVAGLTPSTYESPQLYLGEIFFNYRFVSDFWLGVRAGQNRMFKEGLNNSYTGGYFQWSSKPNKHQAIVLATAGGGYFHRAYDAGKGCGYLNLEGSVRLDAFDILYFEGGLSYLLLLDKDRANLISIRTCIGLQF